MRSRSMRTAARSASGARASTPVARWSTSSCAGPTRSWRERRCSVATSSSPSAASPRASDGCGQRARSASDTCPAALSSSRRGPVRRSAASEVEAALRACLADWPLDDLVPELDWSVLPRPYAERARADRAGGRLRSSWPARARRRVGRPCGSERRAPLAHRSPRLGAAHRALVLRLRGCRRRHHRPALRRQGARAARARGDGLRGRRRAARGRAGVRDPHDGRGRRRGGLGAQPATRPARPGASPPRARRPGHPHRVRRAARSRRSPRRAPPQPAQPRALARRRDLLARHPDGLLDPQLLARLCAQLSLPRRPLAVRRTRRRRPQLRHVRGLARRRGLRRAPQRAARALLAARRSRARGLRGDAAHAARPRLPRSDDRRRAAGDARGRRDLGRGRPRSASRPRRRRADRRLRRLRLRPQGPAAARGGSTARRLRDPRAHPRRGAARVRRAAARPGSPRRRRARRGVLARRAARDPVGSRRRRDPLALVGLRAARRRRVPRGPRARDRREHGRHPRFRRARAERAALRRPLGICARVRARAPGRRARPARAPAGGHHRAPRLLRLRRPARGHLRGRSRDRTAALGLVRGGALGGRPVDRVEPRDDQPRGRRAPARRASGDRPRAARHRRAARRRPDAAHARGRGPPPVAARPHPPRGWAPRADPAVGVRLAAA